MENFPCTYFRFSTRYPESGLRMQLGRSYVHTAAAQAPDQRLFQLSIPGLQYFCDAGGDLTAVTEPGRNMLVLENFYNDHKLAFSFNFDHPVYGTLVCKFNRPLEIPEGVMGGTGVLEEVRVELLEIP